MEQKLTVRPDDEKKNLLNRLKRIEGQVRGIEKMVGDDRYCMEVLVQISAVEKALNNVALNLTERHMKHCVTNAIKENDGEQSIDELMTVLKQFTK